MAAIEMGTSQFGTGSYTTDTNWTNVLTVSSTNFTASTTYLIGCMASVGGNNTATQDFSFRVVHGSTPTSFTSSEQLDRQPMTTNAALGDLFIWFEKWTQPGTAEDIIFQAKTANASNAVEWAGGTIFWIELDQLTEDTDYRYATDATGAANSTTYATRLTETWTPANNNDDWLVLWFAKHDINIDTINSFVELSDGTTTIELQEEGNATTETGRPLGGAYVFTLPNSSQSFTIKTKDETSGTQNDYARSGFFALRLNAFEDHSMHQPAGSITATDTTTWYTSGQATITFTPTTAGDIFIMPYARVAVNNSGSHMRLNRATDNFSYMSSSGDGYGWTRTDITNYISNWFADVQNLTASSQTIGVEYKSIFGGDCVWDKLSICAFSAELGIALTQEYPDADVAATGWDTQPTPSQSLYVQVDETTPSDTDYIHPT